MSLKRITNSIATLCVMGIFPVSAQNDELYQKISRASVEILADGHLEASGWFADAEGHVITVSHVSPAKKFEIVSPVAGRVEAKLVAIDCGHDIALFKIPSKNGGYPFLSLAKKFPSTTQEVYMYGTPLSRRNMLLSARVARPRSGFEFYRNTKYHVEVNYAAGQAPNGISGGAWVDAKGDVVGMQSGTVLQYSIPQGIICSSPLESLRAMLSSKRSAQTIDLGANMVDFEMQSVVFISRFAPGTTGAVITALVPDGVAQRSGLREGDVVVSVDGKVVLGTEGFLRYLRGRKKGDDVILSVYDPAGQGKRDVRVKLESIEEENINRILKR